MRDANGLNQTDLICDMPQPMKIWRKRARAKLIEQLGGVCACGSTENLVFAHKVPLSEDMLSWRSRIGANKRMTYYRRLAKKGEIYLACQSCNMKQTVEPRQGAFL